MKRLVPVLLPAALAVSLWFNWHGRRDSAAIPAPLPAAVPARAANAGATRNAEKPAPVLTGQIGSGEIDFSGTGFADDSWKLEPSGHGDKIPGELPNPGTLETPSALPAEPPGGNWNLEESQNLQLTPGKNS